VTSYKGILKRRRRKKRRNKRDLGLDRTEGEKRERRLRLDFNTTILERIRRTSN
jgi:hypothetical protein